MPDRTVFYVSDGTGITAQTFGGSILAQFPGEQRKLLRPFIDSVDKAEALAREIDAAAARDGKRPIVFLTLVDDEVREIVRTSRGMVLDMITHFVEPLEAEFGVRSNHRIGRFTDAPQSREYEHRMEAISYSLAHDDGQSSRNLDGADVVLVGVSRCGKTPTSLYLAIQHGIKAANYPLIPEDFDRSELPKPLVPHVAKCFGLTIDPARLAQVRHERRPDSTYASLDNCRDEVREAERLMKRHGIHWLSSTHKSIEEIAAVILRDLRPDVPVY